MDLQCSICRDIFDDAVLARDGFPYCRSCILKWAGDGDNTWKSPRTNEMIMGHPVLCTDIERNCKAREMRLAEARKDLRDPHSVLRALPLTHASVPLLTQKDCVSLAWHPVILTSPYTHLSILVRGNCLQEMPFQVAEAVCKLDRTAVEVPLIEMGVLRSLLREVLRRCIACREEDSIVLMRNVKEHFLWRSSFSDAVEIPPERAYQDKVSGVYSRAWTQTDRVSLVFLKGQGLSEQRLFLHVPLERDSTRGFCERCLVTRVLTEASFANSSNEASVKSVYGSELPVREAQAYWRIRRGGLPFPDSRGQNESEEEDWEVGVPVGCEFIFEQRPQHLPKGFVYIQHREETAHWYELMAEIGSVNEMLLGEEHPFEDARPFKRPRRGA